MLGDKSRIIMMQETSNSALLFPLDNDIVGEVISSTAADKRPVERFNPPRRPHCLLTVPPPDCDKGKALSDVTVAALCIA